MPKRGTIILIPFPFTDLSGAKVRPALVISSISRGDDMVVIFISSKKEKIISSSDIVVSPTKGNGIKGTSVICCGKIATLEKKMALGELGVLEKEAMKKVDSSLKKVLGL